MPNRAKKWRERYEERGKDISHAWAQTARAEALSSRLNKRNNSLINTHNELIGRIHEALELLGVVYSRINDPSLWIDKDMMTCSEVRVCLNKALEMLEGPKTTNTEDEE